MIEDGVNPELLLGRKYGHALHFWDLAARRDLQTVDLGEQHQMVLELRPSHDPEQTWASWCGGRHRRPIRLGVAVEPQDGIWRADKVITIPAEPATGHAAARAQAVRRGASAGHRHQPVR